MTSSRNSYLALHTHIYSSPILLNTPLIRILSPHYLMPAIRTSTSIKQRSSSPYIKPEPSSDFAIPSLPPHIARKVKREDTPRPSTSYFADVAFFGPLRTPSPDRKLGVLQNLLRDLTPLSDLTSLSPTPQPVVPPRTSEWSSDFGLIVYTAPPQGLGPTFHQFYCRRDHRLRCKCNHH